MQYVCFIIIFRTRTRQSKTATFHSLICKMLLFFFPGRAHLLFLSYICFQPLYLTFTLIRTFFSVRFISLLKADICIPIYFMSCRFYMFLFYGTSLFFMWVTSCSRYMLLHLV